MRKSYVVPALIALTSFATAATAQPAGPADPAPAPAQSGPAPVDSPSATPDAPVAKASPAAQMVDREFSSYDLDKNGSLSETEFAAWVGKLRKPAADGAPQQDPQQFSASLFARADTDSNKEVSKSEMTTLLNAAQG